MHGWFKRFADQEIPQYKLDVLAIKMEKRLQSKKKKTKNGRNVNFTAITKRAIATCKTMRTVTKIDYEANKKRYEEVNSDAFLMSYEWRRTRMEVLKRDGAKCACCGATPAKGSVMNVDHIKPRRLFPNLALDVENLQVLCSECNHGKGNWDMTDWRIQKVSS